MHSAELLYIGSVNLRKLMASTDPVKPEPIEQFWNAYRAYIEAHHNPPQWSGYYVRWVQEFVEFQQETNLQDRSAVNSCLANVWLLEFP